MPEKKQVFHGSDLEKIEEIYGIKKESVIPFGGNVNPLGISPLFRKSLIDHVDAVCTYPDRDYKSLRTALSLYTKAPLEHIITGNGVTELISLTMHLIRPKKALLLSPTYSEYMREISMIGGSCQEYELSEASDFNLDLEDLKSYLTDDIDLFAFCNPNNPTSSALSRNETAEILSHCKKHNIFVLVDETYVEFAPDMDGITAVPLAENYDNVLILRGTSKFFAAPGIRLGYGISGNLKFLKAMEDRKNPWSINTLAALAGEAMFMDTGYIEETKAYIEKERQKCRDRLSPSASLKIYPSYANFLLVRLMDGTSSYEMFERCIKKGLMIRDCSSFDGLHGEYIRFCFRRSEENDMLLDTLLDDK
ncbi:pyridoxal phosphate-dependent aminotransferase [Anaerostipes sp.]|uniref:pyridoxal phosphate-dependent aminotransferase n=1 Tax=Anaerostipes sp. TaxID=1872530 RepID=UPI0025C28016|nr:aminotransferase class I/II-fold pyridoxal phosphate-dependent enzyme [Anaerostipes sp.]MBS7007189.1 aminotransferase class I/II-fold pyridoxal phosphate-dependent enzyme [Anaerostipes sp.]